MWYNAFFPGRSTIQRGLIAGTKGSVAPDLPSFKVNEKPMTFPNVWTYATVQATAEIIG